MGILPLLVFVDPVMIQEIDTYTGVAMKDVPVIQNYSHMDNLALFVVKKSQVAFFNFSHEVDSVAQFSLLLTIAGDVLSHHSVEQLYQSGPVKPESGSSTR